MNNPPDTLTPDELFNTLSHPVRRWLLKTLPADSSRSIDTLAQDGVDQLAHAPQTTHRKLSLSLQHSHLPRLEQAGLVEVDYNDRKVTLSPSAYSAIQSAASELDDMLMEVDGDPNTKELDE